MIYKNDISNVKEEIGENIGQRIIIKETQSRNKIFEGEATIQKTYPCFFSVKYDEKNNNVTYNYTDILTKDLEVSVFDGKGYCPLIPKVEE